MPSIGARPRSALTRFSVETLFGPSSGTTWNANSVRSSETAIGATATTSFCSLRARATSSCTEVTSSFATASFAVAVTSSGPVVPAPKAFSVTVNAS